LNGPNLNRLGTREPDIYGRETLASVEQRCRQRADALNLELDFRQTNVEGTMVDSIHDAIDSGDGIIINPASLSYLSIAVKDALKMFNRPKIELHITNIHARQDVAHESMISQAVTGVIAGLGTDGYLHALDWMANATR